MINCKEEIGCFDKIELAPTVQIEYTQHSIKYDYITKLFFDMYNQKNILDMMLFYPKKVDVSIMSRITIL
ncbi:hypothetical protein AK964_05225 [Clostridium butyricum]|nr:hypothetical protein AK964_05225 [Clostridium butyricum]